MTNLVEGTWCECNANSILQFNGSDLTKGKCVEKCDQVSHPFICTGSGNAEGIKMCSNFNIISNPAISFCQSVAILNCKEYESASTCATCLDNM